jgi:hypothetical protein
LVDSGERNLPYLLKLNMNTKKLIKKQQQLNVIAACQKYYEMYGPISDRTIDSLNRSIDASLLDNEEKAFSMIVLAEESNKLNDAQPSIVYEKAKTKTTSTTSKKADGGTKTKSRASAKRSTSKTGPTNEAEAGQKRMSVRKEGRKR